MFDVQLIFLPGWASVNAVQTVIQLPFVPVPGMAIETSESGDAVGPTTLPYIDSVCWNMRRQRFECRVTFYFGVPDDENSDLRVITDLRGDGWTDL